MAFPQLAELNTVLVVMVQYEFAEHSEQGRFASRTTIGCYIFAAAAVFPNT